MATTVITSAGMQMIMDAIVRGNLVKVNKYKVGTDYGFTPSKLDSNVHGNIVWTSESTTLDGQPAPDLQVTRVGDNAIQILMRIPNNCGPFVVGNYGFFTDSGELFTLTSLDAPIQKYYDELANSGREILQSVEIAFNMAGDTIEITVNHQLYNDIPVYKNRASLPDFFAGSSNIALVEEFYRVDSMLPVPTFFYKDFSRNEWVPLLLNNDSILSESTRDINLNIRSKF